MSSRTPATPSDDAPTNNATAADAAPVVKQPINERGGPRFGGAGVPAAKSKDFKAATKRLLRKMGPERIKLYLVLLLALVSVTLAVLGPKLLGHATDIIIDGVRHKSTGGGIDFTALHNALLAILAVYVFSSALSYTQSYTLAGVVQRTMYRLRAEVEAKLNRLPLKYIDGQPRGDLLSRVTNDIDNIQQSLQQTLSQLLTSLLTLVGVLVMMVIISPVLAIVALVTVPVSLYTIKALAGRSKPRFIAQWRHTGTLNAQVEEAFTGHAIVKAFGRQKETEERFRQKNEELFE